MGEVIYGVVFGKPQTQVTSLDVELLNKNADVTYTFDDVFYISPPIDLPSDTEPPNESA